MVEKSRTHHRGRPAHARQSASVPGRFPMPSLLRAGAMATCVFRRSDLLFFAAAPAVAASLLSLPLVNTANVDAAALELSDLLADDPATSFPPSCQAPPAAACAVSLGLGLLPAYNQSLGLWMPPWTLFACQSTAMHWDRGLSRKGT